MKRGFIILFITGVTGAAYGQDSLDAGPPAWSLQGYIRNQEALAFDRQFKDASGTIFLHNRINIKWKPRGKLSAALEIRNRFIWGEEIRRTPGYASLLKNSNEKFDLRKTWVSGPSFVLHSNIERLYVDYRGRNWNARLGRQRINWGVTTTWNPNDIFNTYNFLDFDYPERPGSDGLKCQYLFTDFFNIELAYANTGEKNGSVAAARYSWNKAGYDWHLITGLYKEHPTIGIGWAGNIGTAGFKGEAQYLALPGDTSSRLSFSAESDYMFKDGWYLNAGFLFTDKGSTQPAGNWEEINLKPSPENLMPTKWNFIVTTGKEITPLIKGTMSLIYAPGTNLLIFFPQFQYNAAANLDLVLVWQSFFAELQNRLQAVTHQCFLGVKWSF